MAAVSAVSDIQFSINCFVIRSMTDRNRDLIDFISSRYWPPLCHVPSDGGASFPTKNTTNIASLDPNGPQSAIQVLHSMPGSMLKANNQINGQVQLFAF